ncbi:hypothetical protein EYF80_047512 [Liparis tanakae]|uniref:Uncharacterized protein n=1 Tax=Liparis tanakae TaxID=230148 RepID=A0A4Z2FNA4_9TELE|nr:hypothetical protein EYF80_047512 [Liparis tanakae]
MEKSVEPGAKRPGLDTIGEHAKHFLFDGHFADGRSDATSEGFTGFAAENTNKRNGRPRCISMNVGVNGTE